MEKNGAELAANFRKPGAKVNQKNDRKSKSIATHRHPGQALRSNARAGTHKHGVQLPPRTFRTVFMGPGARALQALGRDDGFDFWVPSRKKAAPGGAAKFREETPRKGREITSKLAMPRCNNIGPENRLSKRIREILQFQFLPKNSDLPVS
ncbi:MAG: hypothetical protein HY243_08480 [Proteobacteria bacterium]|nr:hypothetical protein [Pseudomonadota bacterium]